MGSVRREGDLLVVETRMGERSEWRRRPDGEWFERMDAAAPVTEATRPAVADVREEPSRLALQVQQAPPARPPTTRLGDMLARLDPDQRALAIDWTPEPGHVARALAAAGSGKTHTTISLVGRLITEGRLAPAAVVITTFTKKAAGELKTRFKAALPAGQVPERVGTFHSLALRALRELDAGRWDVTRCVDLPSRGPTKGTDGIPSGRTLWRMVLDGSPMGDLVELLDRPGLGLLEDESTVSAYMSAAEILRSRPQTREALFKAAAALADVPRLDEALRLYFAAKEKLRAFDWADALDAWHGALARGELTSPAALVAVDEAQDCTAIQLDIARLLASSGTLLLVGDVRQAIYQWRGAAPEILAEADRTLGATTLQLRRNYRSGRRIVELGNAICEGESWAVGDPAMPVRPEAGEVTFNGEHADPRAEADGIAHDILVGGGPHGRAILCRTRAGTALVEASLMAAGIPCAVAGGSSFFESKVAKDSLAFYALSVPGMGGADELGRVVGIPFKRYLGKVFVKEVRDTHLDVVAGVRKVARESKRLKDYQAKSALELADMLAELRKTPWDKLPVRVARLVAASAIQRVTDDRDGSNDVVALAETMATVAARFASPAEVQRFADKCTGSVKALDDGETDEGRAVISTIHKAKGLEWDQVYVAGVSAGIFPHAKSDTPERRAEERRLFYVAVTRAKNRLVLSWSRMTAFGAPAGPSEFAELAVEAVLGPRAEPLGDDDGDDEEVEF